MDNVKCTTCGSENPVNYKYCFTCGYELPKIKTESSDHTFQPKSKVKTEKRNKWTGIIVGAIFFLISYFAVQQLFFSTPLYDKAMMKIAGEINKSCPLMIDENTRLDNSVALPKNVFQYNYTLVNLDIATVDPKELENYLEPKVISYVKTNPQMKPQRDHKTTINYYYKDKAGVFLFLISVTPDKYE